MVIKDIDREEIDFIVRTLGVSAVTHIDHFTSDKLATAELAEEITVGDGKVVKITGFTQGL